ncbi:MAG TPA: hypothetical protein HA348_05575 [Thermoplasmata archaeon]|nr:hypothetical protein [Thermoplasmata archaeon]
MSEFVGLIVKTEPETTFRKDLESFYATNIKKVSNKIDKMQPKMVYRIPIRD